MRKLKINDAIAQYPGNYVSAQGSSRRIETRKKPQDQTFYLRQTAYGYSALLKRYVGTSLSENSVTARLVHGFSR